MSQNNRPRSREKHVTSGGKGVNRRGSGLGTGPVGNGHSGGGRSGGSGGGKRSSGGQRSSSGGSKSPLTLIIGLIVLLLGGGGGAMTLLGGSSGTDTAVYSDYSTSSGWCTTSNVKKLDTSVAKGSRDKYTTIKGDGKDVTTIMVYMCGTDLESKYGMATSDLQEMMGASFDDHINIIVYTGGCKQWKNNVVSSSKNQIYQVKNGKLKCLKDSYNSGSMTKPANLTSFIEYCTKNYPANRNDLILWDHGGGSITGYGYDEKNSNSGSMTLAGIQSALKAAKTKFDFIGFDACLMATTENAIMLSDYADYLIASEESEPGIGWYYTNWLTEYGKDPSMDTLSLGKLICDDFVTQCGKKCSGQETTLSVVDLAEVANTVPSALKAFSKDTTSMLKNSEYSKVATARSKAHEFAKSSKIDQVDFVDLAVDLDTDESKDLADALLGAVKYNNVSSNLTNAYGLSVYFPCNRTSYVDTAVSTYSSIGMDSEYSRCIKNYATVASSGQAVYSASSTAGSNTTTTSSSHSSSSGSYSSYSSYGGALGSLLGQSLTGGSADSDMINEVLQQLLTSGMSSSSSGKSLYLTDNDMDQDDLADYLKDNQFDESKLTWSEDSDGNQVISLEEDQWSMVTDLEENMFYDDGQGYVDLGLDNTFDFNDDGDLIASTDKTWLSINGQPVAYYHTSTEEEDDDNYTIRGYVPAMLNGTRVNLILVFDQDNPNGYIAGATTDYNDKKTDTVAKSITELKKGDKLDFLCDYYSYDGEYQDSYYLGDTMKVTDDMEISNTEVGEGDVLITYRFVDTYGNEYWSETVK